MILATIFLFGLAVGSFLNALVYRMEKEESVAKGRSYCDSCKHVLGVLDLIPLLSFLMLGGRCRYCKEKISIQYPLVELAIGILFVMVFQIENTINLQAVYLLVAVSLLVVIFVYDLKHYIIPDKIIYSAIFISGLWYLSSIVAGSYTILPLYSALGAAAFFLAIFLLSRGSAMGFGDVKLVFFMGLFLSWPNILVALFIAFFIGAIIGTALIIFGKKEMRSEVPFGPFLIGGTLLALLFGEELVHFYTSFVML